MLKDFTIKIKLNLKHFKVFLNIFKKENEKIYTKQLQIMSMGQMNMKHGAMPLFKKTHINDIINANYCQ